MIKSVTVDGSEVQRIIWDRLMPALEGESFECQILSMLTLSVLMMKPDIDIDRLQDIVMSTSEHILMNIADFNEGVAN